MNIKAITDEFENFNEQLETIGRPAVSIFGGARASVGSKAYDAAQSLGYKLGSLGYTIITGGGPGVMEAANKGAEASDSESVGLVINLPFESKGNDFITNEVNFDYFFPRKVAFASNSDAFVVMPGGLGTLDELFEMMTLIQCEKMRPKPIVLYDSHYWFPLIDMLHHMASKGALNVKDLKMLYITDDTDDIINYLNDQI